MTVRSNDPRDNKNDVYEVIEYEAYWNPTRNQYVHKIAPVGRPHSWVYRLDKYLVAA